MFVFRQASWLVYGTSESAYHCDPDSSLHFNELGLKCEVRALTGNVSVLD